MVIQEEIREAWLSKRELGELGYYGSLVILEGKREAWFSKRKLEGRLVIMGAWLSLKEIGKLGFPRGN